MTKKTIIVGKEIHYRITGKGPHVMLVHGFGETGDVWKNQVAFLENKYRLIVPDLPGSGASEMIADRSMEGMAEVVKKIMEIEDWKEMVLIGHSMGGYITLAFAEKYPESLRGFGLFHSTAYADSEEKKAVRRKGIEFIRSNGPFEFLKTTTPNLFSPSTRSENQAIITSFLQDLNNFSEESLVSYYEAMMRRPDRTAILTNSKVPVLFILGEFDNAVPLEDGLKLCSLPEKAYIHIFRKSGHMGMIEEADYSNKILENYLSGAWLF